MLVHNNLRHLRNTSGLTQHQLAVEIGIGRPMIGQLETCRVVPTILHLEKYSVFFKVPLDDLVKKDLSNEDLTVSNEVISKILSITVDREGEETVVLVPQKAAAGYLNGYSDPEYIEKLPYIGLPMLKNGTFRAFEISGDSMLPIQPGSIVIGKYLDGPGQIKDNKTYVIVSETEGIVYKRVEKSKDALMLISDNTVYASYQIHYKDILEIWEAKVYISSSFPEPL